MSILAFQTTIIMKNNYLKALVLVILTSSLAFSQKNIKYNGEAAFQKTIELTGFHTETSAIKELGKLYGLNEASTFTFTRETSDEAGFTHQRYQQFYRGIKIEFGTVITHKKEGNVVKVNGELYNAIGLNLVPTLKA